eukprot:1462947-Prymnesium_polylepis.1
MTRRWPLALRAVHAAIRGGCGNPKVVSRSERISSSLSGLLVRIAACERISSGLSGLLVRIAACRPSCDPGEVRKLTVGPGS